MLQGFYIAMLGYFRCIPQCHIHRCLTIAYFTGKDCDVAPYNDAYETKKAVPIVQAAIECDNTETGDNTILILDEAIWMSEIMDQNMLNPNQLRSYGMTVQYNPFTEAPIFIAT